MRKTYKITRGLKASAYWTTWISGIQLRSCIDILTSIQSGAQQATGRASGSLIYDVLLQTAPQSHLLQTKPSPPLQGVPHQKATPWLHKNPQRWGDFYDGATYRPLISVPKCGIYRKARLGLDCWRTVRQIEHRFPFMLSSSAHTKHSSPPPQHTHKHTHPLPLPTLPPILHTICHRMRMQWNISRELARAGGQSLPINHGRRLMRSHQHNKYMDATYFTPAETQPPPLYRLCLVIAHVHHVMWRFSHGKKRVHLYVRCFYMIGHL